MDIPSIIEHTFLSPAATVADIDRICAEARQYGFAAVCVAPLYVPQVAERLVGSSVSLATVVGFPLGAHQTAIKQHEADLAVEQGAQDIDMVMAIGRFLEGNHAFVYEDIAAVVRAVPSAIVKVIIETGYLTSDQIAQACCIARDAGAAYVKTCTGFGPRGATVEDVRSMRAAVGDALRIKASGGIRTREQALELIAAGANRIGTSQGVQILGE